MKRRRKRVGLGIFAGTVGGLLGAFIMNQFQAVVSEVQKKQQQRQSPRSSQQQGESEDATMKAAEKVSETVLDLPLCKDEKKKWGPVVHYAFGATMGAVYGGLSAVLPETSLGFGTAFGTALFAVADEIAVPALGLSKPPTETPASSHVMALASHLVWGSTTEAVRRMAA